MTRGERLAVATFALRQIERGMDYNPAQVARLALSVVEADGASAEVPTVDAAALVAAAEKRAAARRAAAVAGKAAQL